MQQIGWDAPGGEEDDLGHVLAEGGGVRITFALAGANF